MRGFTLLEIVMAIVVTVILSIPLSLTVSQYVKSVFFAQDMAMAVNLGRYELERLNKMPYAGMAGASFPDDLGYGYDVDITVVFIQGNASSAESLKQITVDVKKSGSATVLASFVTYFAKNILYGL